jgi:polyisoprenoid-binding protein YceI
MTTAVATAVRTYDIDKAHSEVTFQVRHLLTKVRGRFADFAGVIDFNPDALDESSVKLTINAASIDTNQPDRDAHLRSADFFAADTFPTLTFQSTKIVPRAHGEYEVTGDLAIHGVTKTVTVPVSYLGVAKDPWGNEKAGFEAEAVLDRRDFGLTWNAALETGGFLVGVEVRVRFDVQAKAR